MALAKSSPSGAPKPQTILCCLPNHAPMTGFDRPPQPRDPHEAHRAATPLELFFDLVSVIAIAAAAAGLHHAISADHAVEGLATYVLAFFAIWWAWMNYTWYASAYDNDDALFRVLTMVIMSGSLIMAAGLGTLFEHGNLTMLVLGYVVMRVGMVALWLRASAHDQQRRRCTLVYAIGIALAQVYWVAFLMMQPLAPAYLYSLFAIGVVIELAVPVVAERSHNTPWHRHHIIERYGLLNIIVLGETLLAGAMSLRQLAGGATEVAFAHIAMSAVVIVFAMWWLYFSREEHLQSNDLGRALTWGYGHYLIFASGAAVGAGFAVLVDVIAGEARVSLLVGDYAVAVPLALYLVGLWFVRDRFCLVGPGRFVLPVFAVLMLLAPFTPIALEGIAALSALAVVCRGLVVRSQVALA